MHFYRQPCLQGGFFKVSLFTGTDLSYNLGFVTKTLFEHSLLARKHTGSIGYNQTVVLANKYL